MSTFKGDFLGFSFNGTHSSELGIVRTSEGSRYTDNLLPNVREQTEPIPGGDGTYYWSSNFVQKSIPISFAFDSITESQLRKLRTIFNTKTSGKLIFDETPFKYYNVKPTGIPQIKYICFNENNQRIYKGEGTIQFIAYDPYAHSVHKFLDEYSNINKLEWAEASQLKPTKGQYDDISQRTIKLFNAGDVETDFKIYFGLEGLNLTQIRLDNGPILNFSNLKKIATDNLLCINTKTELIEGCNLNKEPTGTLYNKFISSGDFFKIPIGESTLVINSAAPKALEYDYLYY